MNSYTIDLVKAVHNHLMVGGDSTYQELITAYMRVCAMQKVKLHTHETALTMIFGAKSPRSLVVG